MVNASAPGLRVPDRYTGFALADNFSTAFFAGPSQTITNHLIETTGHQLEAGAPGAEPEGRGGAAAGGGLGDGHNVDL